MLSCTTKCTKSGVSSYSLSSNTTGLYNARLAKKEKKREGGERREDREGDGKKEGEGGGEGERVRREGEGEGEKEEEEEGKE